MSNDIKYYLYLSKVKVDMLWEQLNRNDLEKISAELKINIWIFFGGIRSEAKDENFYAKLNVIVRYLESKELIGTIEQPKKIFAGTMPMTWKEVDFYNEQSKRRMVLFSGYKSNPDQVVGLIGSAAHVIGMKEIHPATLGYAQPAFWMKLAEELNPPTETELVNNLYDLDQQIHYQARRRKDGPPTQNLQFISKTFLTKEGFLLGSPIYVAETEIYWQLSGLTAP